jgi:hypothetical protein
LQGSSNKTGKIEMLERAKRSANTHTLLGRIAYYLLPALALV